MAHGQARRGKGDGNEKTFCPDRKGVNQILVGLSCELSNSLLIVTLSYSSPLTVVETRWFISPARSFENTRKLWCSLDGNIR
jgi:hypothetical protein